MATKKEKRKPIDFEYADFIVWFNKKYHYSHWNIIKELENAGADARKNWKHLVQFLKNDGFTPSQVFDLAMESHKFEFPKLRNLKVPLAGKTGTTNKNMDAWFLGFTSKLVIGVYVGFDEPKTLGKYETGAKAALPVFKKFIKNVIKKKDAHPFKIPKDINLVLVDVETGLLPNNNTKKMVYESFKSDSNFIVSLEKLSNKDRLGFYDSENQQTILRFY